MTAPTGFWAGLAAFLQRRSVKTPLVFFFEIIGIIFLFSGAMGYTNVSPENKFILFRYALMFMVGIVSFVAACLVFRPKHMVYGSEEHLEEHKMEYGTDRKPISAQEIELLFGTTKPSEEEMAGEL